MRGRLMLCMVAGVFRRLDLSHAADEKDADDKGDC